MILFKGWLSISAPVKEEDSFCRKLADIQVLEINIRQLFFPPSLHLMTSWILIDHHCSLSSEESKDSGPELGEHSSCLAVTVISFFFPPIYFY